VLRADAARNRDQLPEVATRGLRAIVTAEDITASLIGIFTVATRPNTTPGQAAC
jgi:hypothetical protein